MTHGRIKDRNLLTLGCCALLIGVGLCGCLGAEANEWGKPGVSDQQRRADYATCESMTRSATKRDSGIDQDILSSRGADWRNAGVYSEQVETNTLYTGNETAQMLSGCMRDLGYRRAE